MIKNKDNHTQIWMKNEYIHYYPNTLLSSVVSVSFTNLFLFFTSKYVLYFSLLKACNNLAPPFILFVIDYSDFYKPSLVFVIAF